MSATPKVNLPHPETGELVEVTQEGLEGMVVRLQDELREKERTIRSQAHRIGDLERDKQKEAEENPLWPKAVELHQHYNRVMGRRSVWKLDVFELCEPFLKKYPIEVHHAAIEGLKADHFVSTRSNGTTRHHHGWHILYRDTDRFEEAVNSADVETLQVLREEGLLPGMTPKPKGSASAQRSLIDPEPQP
jgi:hypothetical protein